MRGDALASGDKRATFAVAPNLKFDEGIMRDDLRVMSTVDFIFKYHITQREYDIIYNSRDDEKISSFAADMKMRGEMVNRALQADASQEATLKRDCPIRPFVPLGITGRVIVNRDIAIKKRSQILIPIPRSMRKEREMLPTTGHIISASLYDVDSKDISDKYIGLRILFSPMSGTAICLKGYPTWIQLEVSEIMSLIIKEDVQIEEETLEPMV